MAAGSVIKTGAKTFEVTRTIQHPSGAQVTSTVPLTLKHARAGVAQLNREIARLEAMIAMHQARAADIQEEIGLAIEQGVEEEGTETK
jgi:hypothetical protein